MISVRLELSSCDLALEIEDLWVGDCGVPNPPKDPNEPESLLAKLLLLLWTVAEDLLDTVDCDQRLRLPTPSVIPFTLFARLWGALFLRFESGERARCGRLEVRALDLTGFWELRLAVEGRPLRVVGEATP